MRRRAGVVKKVVRTAQKIKTSKYVGINNRYKMVAESGTKQTSIFLPIYIKVTNTTSKTENITGDSSKSLTVYKESQGGYSISFTTIASDGKTENTTDIEIGVNGASAIAWNRVLTSGVCEPEVQ